MKIMFFDTETTGFNPPAILQIWIIIWEYEEDWKIIKEESIDLLFNPNEEIHESASNIHWFTIDKVKNEPFFKTFIPKFVKYVKDVDLVVWHNVQFDIKAIEFEINRLYIERKKELDEKVINFLKNTKDKSKCTMLSAVDFCKLPNPRGWYKWPKLLELHKILFDKEFDCAHNAMADIQATRDCFFELKKRNIIT
jgi:DNA polymerase III epsilon subunit-like protein